MALCFRVRFVPSKGDVCLWRHVLQEEAICACFWVDESAALAIAAAACVYKGAADLYSKQQFSLAQMLPMCSVIADDWGDTADEKHSSPCFNAYVSSKTQAVCILAAASKLHVQDSKEANTSLC